MSARTSDINGYIDIADNPISKIGVFPYLGSQMGLKDPALAGRVFMVLRPEEELSDPECIKSFQLLPFVDEHAMLGAEDKGGLPAERKGVQGFIGEQVRYERPYLRGNIRIVSESMKNTIDSGKIELSPGYRCIYDLTTGVWEGQNYDAVQRRIRGNHLALVDEGRTGADVAVLDAMTFTIDTKEFGPMAEENPAGTEDIKSLLAKLKPLLKEQSDMAAALAELGITMPGATPAVTEEVIDEDPAKLPGAATDEDPAKLPAAATDEEPKMAEIAAAMDSMSKLLKGLTTQVAALQIAQTGMDAALVAGIAERDELAKNLSNFVGTFDSARMTTGQVAEYGCKQLGIPTVKGQELGALKAWMHGREAPHKRALVNTMDGKTEPADVLGAWGKQ